MGSEVKFNIFSRLFTNENNIFMSKIVKQWLRNRAPIQFLRFRIGCVAIFDKILYPPPPPPLAYYCSPPSLFGNVYHTCHDKSFKKISSITFSFSTILEMFLLKIDVLVQN